MFAPHPLSSWIVVAFFVSIDDQTNRTTTTAVAVAATLIELIDDPDDLYEVATA